MRMNLFSWRLATLFSFLSLVVITTSCHNDDPEPPPVIDASNFEVTIFENPLAGTVLGALKATTDKGTLTFQLLSESVPGAFSIDATTGSLSVLDSTKFVFDTNPILSAMVSIINDNVTSQISVKVNLQKIIIQVTDFEVTIEENPLAAAALGTLSATTNTGKLSFQLKAESVPGAFSVNATTGALAVLDNTKFDFEKNPILTAVVSVINGKVQAQITIKVNLKKIIWEGANMSFTKASGADWTLVANYDKITDKVIFTRQNSGPLYNYQWWQDNFGVDATFNDLSDDFWDGANSDKTFTRQGGTNGVRWAILDNTGSTPGTAWDNFNLYGGLGDPTNFYSFHDIATIITMLEIGRNVTGVADDFNVVGDQSNSSGTTMSSLVGKKLGVWLVEEDIYLTLTFTAWGSSNDNSISYIRSTKN